MPMKNPPHVGRVIWHGIFEPLGLSVTKAAEVLGVRRATLSDLVNGKAALTAEMALRIHKAFGPDIGHLLRMQAAYEAAQISKHSKSIKVKRYVAKAA
ncbi:MAG TPA: HigA family addiction module antitoxin [Xanthobacteraceae bacterium]|jgi:addiction module HigA family antidote|nr:HigA family addiction module antitoxin [Xanthobacteraceae bacterium]